MTHMGRFRRLISKLNHHAESEIRYQRPQKLILDSENLCTPRWIDMINPPTGGGQKQALLAGMNDHFMRIQVACGADLPMVLAILNEAAQWLAAE